MLRMCLRLVVSLRMAFYEETLAAFLLDPFEGQGEGYLYNERRKNLYLCYVFASMYFTNKMLLSLFFFSSSASSCCFCCCC
jgi:hypothetical protein